MDPASLRREIRWSNSYREDWDGTPDEYEVSGAVMWGKSRRLGALQKDLWKAYVGVQHVDPGRAGWNIVEEPECRFFVSLFYRGRVLTLRTFHSMAAALDFLASAMSREPS